MSRNRIRTELGKGVEMLRHEEATLFHSVAGALTFTACIGPFETDVEIKEVVVTAGAKPTANAGNIWSVYNGTVAGAKKVVTDVVDANLTAQVPYTGALTANTRVLAGTPVTVVGTFAGDDSVTPASVRVRVGYDIPVDGYATAKMTTYGAYDDGN